MKLKKILENLKEDFIRDEYLLKYSVRDLIEDLDNNDDVKNLNLIIRIFKEKANDQMEDAISEIKRNFSKIKSEIQYLKGK